MTSQSPSDPSEVFRKWTNRIVFCGAGLIALVLVLSFWGSQSYEHGTTSRPTAAFRSVARKPVATVPPRATLTFTDWRSDAITVPYQELRQDPDYFFGELVYFRGYVQAIMGGARDRGAHIKRHRKLMVSVSRDPQTGSWTSTEGKVILNCYNERADNCGELGKVIEFVAIMKELDSHDDVPVLTAAAVRVD